MKTLVSFLALCAVLVSSGADAASSLECELSKREILTLHQEVTNPPQNNCEADYRLCMQTTRDAPHCQNSRQLCQSATMMGEALGFREDGNAKRQRLQGMINSYKQSCQ